MNKALLRDNRGLTLVELIVGVTIMAIIFVPLLHAFVSAAVTENKSREYGAATEAAQNLSEKIQSVDAGLILKKASSLIDNSANINDVNFYTFDGTVYAVSGKTPPPPSIPAGTNKTYYLGIPSYSYDSCSFDAMVTLTLDAADTANSTDVSISNQMGAYLDMSAADKNALQALQAECGNLVDPALLTKRALTRSITLDITKGVGAEADTYTINLLFKYADVVQPTDTKSAPYVFSYSEISTARVASVVIPNDGSPAFSVYMFFDGYYRDNINNESILINNTTDTEANVFFVNTNKNDAPEGYSANIWYKYQHFSGDTPTNHLVYTNLPKDKIKYRAWMKNDRVIKTLNVTGYLVEKKLLDRKFGMNIKLFKVGTGFSGTPLLDIDSIKLN